SRGEVVALDVGFGFLERRGNVVDVGAHGVAVVIVGEQAVALGEEILEAAGADFGESAGGTEPSIAGGKDRRLGAKPAAARKIEFALVALLDVHVGPMRWQTVESAGECHREQA